MHTAKQAFEAALSVAQTKYGEVFQAIEKAITAPRFDTTIAYENKPLNEIKEIVIFLSYLGYRVNIEGITKEQLELPSTEDNLVSVKLLISFAQ